MAPTDVNERFFSICLQFSSCFFSSAATIDKLSNGVDGIGDGDGCNNDKPGDKGRWEKSKAKRN